VKLPEPFTFFVDRSLGRKGVVLALRAAGEQVHAHDDHFAQDTLDAKWLVEVGQRGWIVFCKDKEIRRNQLERVALVQSNVACIMLGRGDLTASEMGRIFVENLPLIRRVLRRFEVPLAASLSTGGTIRVLLAAGQWLQPPKEFK
jgi:predicted nuclease of predicted toxin-antitoxin system